jgi:hypothetical protein
MTYEVEFRRNYTDENPTITKFENPKDALAHADKCVTDPSGKQLPYYSLRIHDTSNDLWLTYAQLKYWIVTGKYFGPSILKLDGSIV